MLNKYSCIIGLPVISASDGTKIGVLKDVVFTKDNKGIIAFLLDKNNHAVKGNSVLLQDVLSLGSDALIIGDSNNLIEYKNLKKTFDIQNKSSLRGCKVYTHGGNDLGIVQDILFDYKTGKVEGVQVSDGLVQDIMVGRNILPFLGRIEIGNKNILVDSEAVEEMTSTGGGLKSRLEN